VTVVPRNVFTGARPVAAAALRIQPQTLAQAKVTPMLRVAPSIASLGVASANRPARKQTQLFARPVIARHAPPAPAAPFADRLKAISDQGGAPLAQTQMRDLRQARAREQHAPARIVLAAPGGGAINPTARPALRAPSDTAQNPANANAPIPNTARPQQPRTTGPQPSVERDRGFARAPRQEAAPRELPQRDVQGPQVQERPLQGDAVEPQRAIERQRNAPRPMPREDRGSMPTTNDNQAPRDQPEPRVVSTPVQQTESQVQTMQQERPPRRDVRVPQAQDVQQRPVQRPEPRVMQQDQALRRDVQAPQAQDVQEQPVQRPAPRERPVAAPRPQMQPQPQATEQPVPTPREKRKPKTKEELQLEEDAKDQQQH
jgi:hypothetical protein